MRIKCSISYEKKYHANLSEMHVKNCQACETLVVFTGTILMKKKNKNPYVESNW